MQPVYLQDAADFWQTEVPKHALIQSARLKAKQASEKAINDFGTRMDMPTIVQGIADARQQEAEKTKVFDDAMAKLNDAPAQMPTTLEASLGEGISGILGLLAGDRNAMNSVAAITENRQGKKFSNDMRAYLQRQKIGEMTAERASRDVDYYRTLGRQREDQLQAGKSAIANLGAQLDMNQMNLGQDIDMRQLADMFQQASEVRHQHFAMQLQNHEAEIQKQLNEIRVKDGERALRIETTLKGLMAMEEDPNADKSDIEAAIEGLKADGFALPPAAATVFKNIAHANFGDRQFKQSMQEFERRVQEQQLRNAGRGLALDEQRAGYLPNSLGAGPGGGFVPVEASAPDGWAGWDTPRPNGVKGEDDWKQLQKAISDLDVKAQKAEGEPDPEVARNYEIEIDALKKNIGNYRRAVLGQGDPKMLRWLLNMYAQMMSDLKSAKVDPSSGAIGKILGPLASPGTTLKDVQDAIRRKFRETTGFSSDDAQLARMFKAATTSMQTPAGPVTAKPGANGPKGRIAR